MISARFTCWQVLHFLDITQLRNGTLLLLALLAAVCPGLPCFELFRLARLDSESIPKTRPDQSLKTGRPNLVIKELIAAISRFMATSLDPSSQTGLFWRSVQNESGPFPFAISETAE